MNIKFYRILFIYLVVSRIVLVLLKANINLKRIFTLFGFLTLIPASVFQQYFFKTKTNWFRSFGDKIWWNSFKFIHYYI